MTRKGVCLSLSTRLVCRRIVAGEGCCSHTAAAVGAIDACQQGVASGMSERWASTYLAVAVVLGRRRVAIVWLGRVAVKVLGRTGGSRHGVVSRSSSRDGLTTETKRSGSDRAIRIIALGGVCSRRGRAVGTLVIARVTRHDVRRMSVFVSQLGVEVASRPCRKVSHPLTPELLEDSASKGERELVRAGRDEVETRRGRGRRGRRPLGLLGLCDW